MCKELITVFPFFFFLSIFIYLSYLSIIAMNSHKHYQNESHYLVLHSNCSLSYSKTYSEGSKEFVRTSKLVQPPNHKHKLREWQQREFSF